MLRKETILRALVGLLALGLAWVVRPPTAAADEFTLKDGRKIVGSIVGYEKDMFRIETDFGFILVRKDKVVSIRVQGGSEKKEEAPGMGAPAAAPDTGSSGQKPESTPQPPPVSRPLNEPLPSNLREHAQGADYVNDTFQFAMFKPLGWKLFEGLHREKVSAIVALSSEDEQTLLFVDRQVWSGAPILADDRVEANLRNTYQAYKKLSESATEVDGRAAFRRDFSGVIDGVEWHGISVRVANGSTVFGIVGLTSSETYHFQQAVINKIIKSFHFISPEPEKGAKLR